MPHIHTHHVTHSFILIAGRSRSTLNRGLPGSELIPAMAGAAPLQTAHAAHDQRGLHPVPEHTPLLLPGELHFLPHTLQPTGAHSQVPSGPGALRMVSAVPVYYKKKSFTTMKKLLKILLPSDLICYVSYSSILYFSSGILPAHPQSCFASLAPLPSFTSSQPSILVLSLIHRHPAFSTVPSVTWSSQIPLN